jgi:hypothetical protein
MNSSVVAEHSEKCDYNINWELVRILAKELSYYSLLYCIGVY